MILSAILAAILNFDHKGGFGFYFSLKEKNWYTKNTLYTENGMFCQKYTILKMRISC